MLDPPLPYVAAVVDSIVAITQSPMLLYLHYPKLPSSLLAEAHHSHPPPLVATSRRVDLREKGQSREDSDRNEESSQPPDTHRSPLQQLTAQEKATPTIATARLLLVLTVVAAAGSFFCSGQELARAKPPLPPPPYCGSVRTAVEAHNIIGWKTFPVDCAKYVADYISGERYQRDSDVVINEAVAYAESVKLSGSGKEVWVFDVDETALSTLPYQAKHRYGVQPYDHGSFLQYVAGGSAPALEGTLRLYQRLLQLGIKPVFLTDRTKDQRAVTTYNLLSQGYSSWEKLLLQPVGQQTSTQAFKTGERKKLVSDGYVIVGNIGDQWSDILESPEGCRTFKYPNPMYYVA